MKRSAILSKCETYRYSLTRTWDPSKPRVTVIGLNPSTADGTKDDNTIRKCIGFAKNWDFGELVMVNLFAFRATNPADMMKATDPIGPENDEYLALVCDSSKTVIVAWGNHGKHLNREKEVIEMLTKGYKLELMCLGKTMQGTPRHPLYVPYSVKLSPFV